MRNITLNFGDNKKITIRAAKKIDTLSITHVNHKSQCERDINGLFQKRSEEEFKRLFDMSKYFFVANYNNQVVGYLLVLDETAPYLDNEIFSYFVKNYNNFVFVDQVAVHPNYRKKGISKAMYNQFLGKETKRVMLNVLIEPKNTESLAFHKSIGFKANSDIIHLNNGMKAGVFEYKTSP